MENDNKKCKKSKDYKKINNKQKTEEK